MSTTSSLADGWVAPLRNADRLVELISIATQESASEIRRRLQSEYTALGSSVRHALQQKAISPYQWSEAMEVFYEQTDAFLYETIVWNLTHAKCEMRVWIGDYLKKRTPGQSVLSFGDGLGFDSMFLADQGHDVTYFEVSQPCSKFAEAIFSDAKLAVDIVTDPTKLSTLKFDTIVCLDVLEHVPDPGSLVEWLQTMLKPEGRLIVSAPFFLVNATVQTHLSSNRKYSGDYQQLYRSRGLNPVAGRLFHNPLVLQQDAEMPIPFQVRLGSLLLKVGRWWSFPFDVSNSVILRAKFALQFAEAETSTTADQTS